MAAEITLSASLTFLKGGIGSSLSVTDLTLDVSGTDYYQGTQQVPITTPEALIKGDVTTPGMILIQNTDSTNSMELIGVSGDSSTIKVEAGETQLFRLSQTDPFVVANTSVVQINYLLIED